MEVLTEVKTYSEDYTCDNCGVGKMRWDGTALRTVTPSIPNKEFFHKCTSCGTVRCFNKQYPNIIHKPVEAPELCDTTKKAPISLDPYFKELFSRIVYISAGLTGLNPHGVYGKEKEIITSVRNELQRGIPPEQLKEEMLKGLARSMAPNEAVEVYDRLTEVLLCPKKDVKRYVNDKYPVNSVALKRMELNV